MERSYMNKKRNYILLNVFKTIGFKLRSISIVFLLTVGCGETQVDFLEEDVGGSSLIQLSPEERAEIVTNELFAALVDNKSIEEIDALISASAISVLSTNERGDTILGTATQFKKEEIALALVDKFACESLSHQNNKGESYIYLASEYGYEKLIHRIANKCFEDDMFNLSDYEFSDLDPPTKEGNVAIHVARDAAVAEALDYEYTKGMFEYSWFAFHAINKNEESFLHKAVQDNRVNTIEWAVRTYCDKGEWEKSDHWWLQTPASIWQHVLHGAQLYLGNVIELVNYKDIKGNTALHVAGDTLNTTAIRLLSNCRWMDYFIENEDGNIALQSFLLALDPLIEVYSQDIKSAFLRLVHRETYTKGWLSSISDAVDHQNKKGDSAAHISACLADPYFYDYLQQYSDLYLKDKSGKVAVEIFTNTQKGIRCL